MIDENITLDHGFSTNPVKKTHTQKTLSQTQQTQNTPQTPNPQRNENETQNTEITIEEPTQEVKDLFGYGYQQIEHYVKMLIEEGQLRGLIGPRELSRIWSRHIVNCAALEKFIPEESIVAEIGSGAGLPGIVIAIMKPDCEIHLIETMQRRTQWLQDCVEEIGLDNVVIHNNRAEELHKKISFDLVTARAVGSIDKLTKWAAPLIKSGGKMVLLKGDKAETELEDAKYTIKKFKLVDPKVSKVKSVMYDEETTVVELRKNS